MPHHLCQYSVVWRVRTLSLQNATATCLQAREPAPPSAFLAQHLSLYSLSAVSGRCWCIVVLKLSHKQENQHRLVSFLCTHCNASHTQQLSNNTTYALGEGQAYIMLCGDLRGCPCSQSTQLLYCIRTLLVHTAIGTCSEAAEPARPGELLAINSVQLVCCRTVLIACLLCRRWPLLSSS